MKTTTMKLVKVCMALGLGLIAATAIAKPGNGGPGGGKGGPGGKGGAPQQAQRAPQNKGPQKQQQHRQVQRAPEPKHNAPRKEVRHEPRHEKKSSWGKGGENFWPGFIGGAVAGLAASLVDEPTKVVVETPVVQQQVVVQQPVSVVQPVVVQQPVTVVQQPVYQTQNVWVEGRYVDTVQANGTILRTWQPGHYETRTVQIQ